MSESLKHDLPPVGKTITIRGIKGTITDHAESGIGWMALWIPETMPWAQRWMTEFEILVEQEGE